MPIRWLTVSVLAASGLMLVACASGPPKTPYPAFVQVDELPDVFMAELPGIRAKQFGGDTDLRTAANRVDMPPAWQGTTGASPGKSLELFVLSGELLVADLKLGPGGYAYLPSGTLGFNLGTASGARVLYFLDDVDPRAVIQTPLILDSRLVGWDPAPTPGLWIKELRADPGSSAKTWLLRIEPGASLGWERIATYREGYLLRGAYQHSECVEGEVLTWQYTPGGYFRRPPGTINGGPDAGAANESVWFLREPAAAEATPVAGCVADVQGDGAY